MWNQDPRTVDDEEEEEAQYHHRRRLSGFMCPLPWWIIRTDRHHTHVSCLQSIHSSAASGHNRCCVVPVFTQWVDFRAGKQCKRTHHVLSSCPQYPEGSSSSVDALPPRFPAHQKILPHGRRLTNFNPLPCQATPPRIMRGATDHTILNTVTLEQSTVLQIMPCGITQ